MFCLLLEEGLVVEDDFDVVVEVVVFEIVLFIGCLVDKVVVGVIDGKLLFGNFEFFLNWDCIWIRVVCNILLWE